MLEIIVWLAIGRYFSEWCAPALLPFRLQGGKWLFFILSLEKVEVGSYFNARSAQQQGFSHQFSLGLKFLVGFVVRYT
jgi:hypothetical protein